MIELNVHSVLYSLLSRHRVVLLKEVQGERYLPIWIGMYESEAIAMRLQGASVPRPLTHDLLANVISEMGGTVQYIVVNDLNDSTFFARIAIQMSRGPRASGEVQLVDSRPSDAIALAVRAGVPVFVADTVMEVAASEPDPSPWLEGPRREPRPEDMEPFREFIDSLDLDDLGG